MKYYLSIELQNKKRVVVTRSITFSEDRWLAARIQALTVLSDCYSEDHKLLGLYLQKRERQKLTTGDWHTVPKLRAVFRPKDFDEPIFDQTVSFNQLKKNLKQECNLYTLFSNYKVLVEQVQLDSEKSIGLLKGTNKLLHNYFNNSNRL